MYNTIVYNQRPYNSPVYNVGYKTLEFLRGIYLLSFSEAEKTLEFNNIVMFSKGFPYNFPIYFEREIEFDSNLFFQE